MIGMKVAKKELSFSFSIIVTMHRLLKKKNIRKRKCIKDIISYNDTKETSPTTPAIAECKIVVRFCELLPKHLDSSEYKTNRTKNTNKFQSNKLY